MLVLLAPVRDPIVVWPSLGCIAVLLLLREGLPVVLVLEIGVLWPLVGEAGVVGSHGGIPPTGDASVNACGFIVGRGWGDKPVWELLVTFDGVCDDVSRLAWAMGR